MGVIIVLGVALVTWSRHQRVATLNAAAHGTPPTLGDHWHEAFAVDLCGTIEPDLPENPNVASAGLHTHGDGNIHIEPISSADTGHNATLGRFVSLYPGMALSATSVQYPGKPAYHDGQKCGSKPGYVQVKVWDTPTAKTGHIVKGNPGSLLLKNGQLITIAFLPKGANIPKPSQQSIQNLQQNMSASAPTEGHANSTQMTLPKTVTTVPASTKPGTSGKSSTSSTAPASSTPTTGAASTSTTAGSTSTTKAP